MKLFPIVDAGGYQFRDDIDSFRAAETTQVVIAVPWDMLAPHEPQALRNHNQTLERLAQRGGLSSGEAVAVLLGTDVYKLRLNAIQSQKKLAELLADWMASRRFAGMSSAAVHNVVAGDIVKTIVRPTLVAGGAFTDVLVLLESVLLGVMLVSVKLGGDEIVLDQVIAGVKTRLAEQRLGGIETKGSA